MWSVLVCLTSVPDATFTNGSSKEKNYRNAYISVKLSSHKKMSSEKKKHYNMEPFSLFLFSTSWGVFHRQRGGQEKGGLHPRYVLFFLLSWDNEKSRYPVGISQNWKEEWQLKNAWVHLIVSKWGSQYLGQKNSPLFFEVERQEHPKWRKSDKTKWWSSKILGSDMTGPD